MGRGTWRAVARRRLAVVVGVTAAACGGTPGSNGSSSTAAAPADVGHDGRAGDVTAAAPAVQTDGFDKLGPVDAQRLVVRQPGPGPRAGASSELTKQFKAKYPNVKINLTFKDFNSLVDIVNRALASDNGPDITEGNQGYQIDAAEVKAKLILPLDKYVQAYGWDKWWGPDTWQIFQWTRDGKTFGQGPKWGVAQTGQNVVLYYNKEKLAAAGIDPASRPTFAKFDAVLATLRAKLPKSEPVIEFGNKEGYGTIHFLGGIQGAYGDAQPMRDWIYHMPGATFETAQNIKALDKLAAWGEGRLLQHATTTRSATTTPRSSFAKGKGVFFFGGNWETAIIKAGPRHRRRRHQHAARPERQARRRSARRRGRGTSRPRRSTPTSPRPG